MDGVLGEPIEAAARHGYAQGQGLLMVGRAWRAAIQPVASDESRTSHSGEGEQRLWRALSAGGLSRTEIKMKG